MIKGIVTIFFLIVGIAAIIIPFIFDFWTLFKIVFICGGIFSLLIAWTRVHHERGFDFTLLSEFSPGYYLVSLDISVLGLMSHPDIHLHESVLAL